VTATVFGRRAARWAVTALVGGMLCSAVACSQPLPYKALAVGECLPSSAKVVGDREPQPPKVPCSQPHRYEVYATPDLGIGSDWPGQSEVYQQAKSLCYGAFAAGTGWDPEKIPDGVDELTIDPSKGGFESGKDRSVECLVVLPKDRKGPFIRTGQSASS
jgi:hypothetical protein